jgi:hypothetical protein
MAQPRRVSMSHNIYFLVKENPAAQLGWFFD